MKKMVLALMCSVLLVGCGKAGNVETVEENVAAKQTEEATSAEDASLTEEPEAVEDDSLIGADLSQILDISECDTFTQIVDKVLEPGMGYTNEAIGDTDALLVCGGAYDNMDGNMAAIDSTIYIYDKDGVPTCIGSVSSNGTAYPLAANDGILYVAIYHGISTYTIKDGELLETEAAWTEYDEDGNETYYYSKDGGDATQVDSLDDQTALEEKYYDASILNFDVIAE